MSSTKPILYQFRPHGPVPSLDYDCLLAQTFFHLSNFKYDVNNCDNPLMSPSENLPFLRLADDSILLGDDIFAEVRRSVGSIDTWLSNEEKADSLAFKILITSKLKKALQHEIWLAEANFTSLSTEYYGKPYEFPLNRIVPWMMKEKIRDSLLLKTGTLDKDLIFEETDRLLKSLSEKLGKKDYFFGSKPSEIDAYLFAYLFIVLKVPMKSQENRFLVYTHNNLVAYTERIQSTFFAQK